MKLFLLIIISSLSSISYAALLKCEYSFMGSPTGSISLDVTDQKPGSTAIVSLFFAPAREVPITNEAPQSGELLNMILAKDDPSNEVQMIVYPDKEEIFPSKVLNNSLPMAKEMQGNCRFLKNQNSI